MEASRQNIAIKIENHLFSCFLFIIFTKAIIEATIQPNEIAKIMNGNTTIMSGNAMNTNTPSTTSIKIGIKMNIDIPPVAFCLFGCFSPHLSQNNALSCSCFLHFEQYLIKFSSFFMYH